MLDLNICSFKELIECAFGEPENNTVNFKVLQTILYLLARQLGILDRLVQVDLVSERRPSTSQSSITVSEIKIKATATTSNKIKPKDVNVKVITRKEDPDRKKNRASASNVYTSIQSRSSDLKTKFVTHGWPYNPSLDDVENTANRTENLYNSPSDKNKDKNKSESQPVKINRDGWYDEIRNPPRYCSDNGIFEPKGNIRDDPKTARYDIQLSLSINESRIGIDRSENIDEREGYTSYGIEELYKDDTAIEIYTKSNPKCAGGSFGINKHISENDAGTAQYQKNNPAKYENLEKPSFIDQELPTFARQKLALLSKSPGYFKEKPVLISPKTEAKYLFEKQNNVSVSKSNEKQNSHIETVLDRPTRDKSTTFKINKHYTDGKEKKKDNTNETNSFREDFISFIGSLEDIISITERERQLDRSKDNSVLNSSYDEIKRTFEIKLSDQHLKSNNINENPRYRSLSEDTFLEKSRPKAHTYTEDHQSSFEHQKYFSFSKRDRHDYFYSMPLHRSASEEVISKVNTTQKHNSDNDNNEDKSHRHSNQVHPQERKKTFDFSKYIKLNQPSFENFIFKNGKEQQKRNGRIKEHSGLKSKENIKPLYRTSSEEIYIHIKKYAGEENALGYETNEPSSSRIEPKQRRMSKYERFYQPSEELFPQFKDSTHNKRYKGQSKPTEKTAILIKENAKKDKKLESSSDYEEIKDEDQLGPMIKDERSDRPRKNDQNKSLLTYKKVINAQDEGKLSKKKIDLPSNIYDESRHNNTEKIRSAVKDAKISLDQKQSFDTYNKNISMFEKLKQAIMSKCHRENATFQNVQLSAGLSESVPYLSLKDALLSKSPGYSSHKQSRKRKHKLNKSDKKIYDTESIINKDNIEKGGLDYIKSKFINKKSETKAESDESDIRDSNQYPSSSEEEIPENFKQIKEYYTEISNNEKASIKNWRFSKEDEDHEDSIKYRNAKENPLYISVSEELISKRVTGLDEDNLAKVKLQLIRNTDKHYPKELGKRSSQKQVENSRLDKKNYNNKSNSIKIKEEYAEKNINKSDNLYPKNQTMSTYDKLKQAIMAKCHLNQCENLQPQDIRLSDPNDIQSDEYSNRTTPQKIKTQNDKQQEKSEDDDRGKKLQPGQQYRTYPQDETQHKSSSDEEISGRERNLSKSRRSDMKKTTKGRSEPERAIKKEKKRFRPEDETHHRSVTEELDYYNHRPQARGLGYEKGTMSEQLETKTKKDSHEDLLNKSGADAQAKDTKPRRKKYREEELYNSSSDENLINQKKERREQNYDKDKSGTRDEGGLKKIGSEERGERNDASVKIWPYAMYDQDLKSKLERQREALFAKCPGFETETILKRDNTLSYRNLINNKINKSKSEDESQDYGQNKMKSRSNTKERVGIGRAKSFDSFTKDLSKYDSQIGAIFSKSPGFTKSKLENYFIDDEPQSYKTETRQISKINDYEKGPLRTTYRPSNKEKFKKKENQKVKHLYSSSSDMAIPKPKKTGMSDDFREEKEAKKRDKEYDRKHKKHASSYEERERPSKDKEFKGRQIQTHDQSYMRQHHRSSSGEINLKDKESSTSMTSEPQNQKPLPSFSDLGDWQVDPSVIITKKSKGSDILNENEGNRTGSGPQEPKYDHGKENISWIKRNKYEKKKKGDDTSNETITEKRTKDKNKAVQQDLKHEEDISIHESRLQEEKYKYDADQAQKRKKNTDKYSSDDSMGSIIEEGRHKPYEEPHKYDDSAKSNKTKRDHASDESFILEQEEQRKKLIASDFQKKKQTKDKMLLDVDRSDILKSGVDSVSSKKTKEYLSDKKDRTTSRYSEQIYESDEKGYSATKLDETKVRLSDSSKTKSLDALKNSIKSKDIEYENNADSKKYGPKLKDGKPLELEKQTAFVDGFKDSKKIKDSAKLDSTTGDSRISKQYDEDESSPNSYKDEARNKSTAISGGTKPVQSEDLLAPDGLTENKGGKNLDIHGVPLEVFEELREQELRVINQRADSREEPDREPSRMLSVPSAEKALADSTKEGQKGKGKAKTKAAPGKLSRRLSEDSEDVKVGKRASITGGSRRPSQDIEEEKILVVERIPLDKEKAREYKKKHKGTPLAVVKLEEFEALVKEVKELDARIRPPSRFSFPGNAELLEHIRNGASLTEAMAALQLSARIEAAENALENIIEMVSKLAAQNPEVDIDKHGQPTLRLPARQEDEVVASKPIDYLGFDALATQQKDVGAKCREGCIRKPEFDQEILKVQKELAKEIGECAQKNLGNIDVLAKNLRHLESKVEDAAHMANRMSDLEDLVSGYSERINAMDTGLSVQMTSYQDQLTQMQHELEEGLENMAETLANAEGDPAAVAELHVKLNILQDDLINTANIQSELEKNEQDVFVNLKDLFTQIEHLRETKADREEVEDALQNKAGLSALNGLISLEHFDALIGDMEAHIGKAYDKFNNQELIWQKAINDLVKELNEKTNLEIVCNLRDDINKKLNMMMDRISELRNIVGEPKAFGTTKRINVCAECLSCKTPAQMEPEDKPTRMPSMKTPPASGGGAFMKEAGDACYPGYPIPHPLDQRAHICNRYCGGSHTLLKNVTRAKSLPGAVTIQKWVKPPAAGSISKPYMVEDPSVSGPCRPCNIVPSVSTIEISPKSSAPVIGRAVFDIEIRESDKCSCFNVEQ